MTLRDAIIDFQGKLTVNSHDTRYCTFAPPEETAGFVDLSANGDGSRGIAFLTDRMVIRLDTDAQQIYYRDIRVTEILPGYETPFEDELMIASPNGNLRISDCGLNKFFLRQLINTLCRMSVNMKDSDREQLEAQLTEEALNYYAADISQPAAAEVRSPVSVAAAAAVQEIAAAKKAALAEMPASHIEITEEKIQWLSGNRENGGKEPAAANIPENISEPQNSEGSGDLDDMTREQTMSYLLDSINEINSEHEAEQISQAPPPPAPHEEAAPKHIDLALTREPDSPDIYIQASRRIRELCENGRISMEQINTAVKEQLVDASEVYSTLDIDSAQLPALVKKHALNLAAAAEHLKDYFELGEDIAARVMFFMLYQMLSYTDRIVQSDESKRQLNYFFVRFGSAGIALSLLDANTE